MGVPGYKPRALRRAPGAVRALADVVGPRAFFLDFNAGVHRFVPGDGGDGEHVLAESARLLRSLVSLVRPRETLFVALDGVAPLAKLNQQRSRRFMARRAPSGAFDRNVITPGTPFMRRLNDRLAAECERLAAESPGLRVVLSGSDEPGEGEHKLLAHARRGDVIYGADADLLVLCELRENGCVVMRESRLDGAASVGGAPGSEYEFIDTSALAPDSSVDSATRCLLSFFCGNDFLPPAGALSVSRGDIERLERVVSSLPGRSLVTARGDVDWASLAAFLLAASGDEDERVARADRAWWSARSRAARRAQAREAARASAAPGAPPLSAQLAEEEEDAEEEAADRPLLQEDDGRLRAICPGTPGWRPRFNRALFGLAPAGDVCRDFLRGVVWTLGYYQGRFAPDGVPSWFYPHGYGPTLLDLSRAAALEAAPPADAAPPAEFSSSLAAFPPCSSDAVRALERVTPPWSRAGAGLPRRRGLDGAHLSPASFRIHNYLRHKAHHCLAALPVSGHAV